MTDQEKQNTYRVGSVFQINETHGRKGWIGCLVMAEEIKDWGIQGFIAVPHNHEEQRSIYIRLKWSEIDYVGQASLVPQPSQ